MSVESQWASREEVQALKEARAEDRQRWAADRAAVESGLPSWRCS